MISSVLRTLFYICVCLITLACTQESSQVVEEHDQNSPLQTREGTLTVTSMATTTLVFSDGETTLITDGYFTRLAYEWPPKDLSVLIEPDRQAISAGLRQLELEKAAAVMVVHSHFDHALDAPIVAKLTGADLLGSESTANIGRGLDLPEEQIRVVVPGEPMKYGRFTVTFYISKHWSLPEVLANAMGNQSIDEPLVPPARFDAYKEGKSYSILLQHPAGNLLIQGSAGYVAGALDGVRADAVFLGIGGLGDLSGQEQENYFDEVVTATGARHIYPIHWDTSTTPLDEPLVPYEDYYRAMEFLERKARETGITVTVLPLGEMVSVDRRARSGMPP